MKRFLNSGLFVPYWCIIFCLIWFFLWALIQFHCSSFDYFNMDVGALVGILILLEFPFFYRLFNKKCK